MTIATHILKVCALQVLLYRNLTQDFEIRNRTNGRDREWHLLNSAKTGSNSLAFHVKKYNSIITG
jgi:hypothetical protein